MNFKKLLNRWRLVFVMGVLVFSSSGCAVVAIGAAAAAGAGTVAFIKGSLVQNLDKSVTRVHKATLAAFKDLKIAVKEDILKDHRAHIKGLMEGNQGLTIDIESMTELSSKIEIRVGLFGDQMKSQMILNAVNHRL